ncbi:MAG: hypoxanthine phosphoribosyltransferase [Syntrophomonadaceae bacterium]|nr:hypoxanthine phosphoribosyltransferase [Syntrophomonadaceae bacterium]
MHRNRYKILLSEAEIRSRVEELARAINTDYSGEELLVVGILKGAFIFMADLVRELTIPIAVDFMDMSSYGASTRSSGEVRILKDLETPVEGKNIIVVEDIVDTGLTLSYIAELLRTRNPKSLRICALLDKPSRRKVDITPDYRGFTIPDYFVVGYGLDYNEEHRNYRDICILQPAQHED